MDSLMISISGIRGIVGTSLTPERVLKFSAGFGRYLLRKHFKSTKVLVGRDTRSSGEMLEHAVISGLVSVGCNPILVGIAPTPSISYNIRELGAVGAVIITASHNEVEWNALKFYKSDACLPSSQDMEEIVKLSDDDLWRPYNKLGKIDIEKRVTARHIEAILNLPILQVDNIRDKGFRVVYDPGNGAGAVINKELLRRLACILEVINEIPNGSFSRPPEPIPQNLSMLSDAVRRENADIGFATDPDADRLSIVDEKGIPIGEENTLALAVHYVLSKQRTRVVTNLSTTRLIDDICASFNVDLIRTPVGEANVAQSMRKNDSKIGGEGNGGVIYYPLHLSRDASVGIALILSLLNESGETINQILSRYPKYLMEKHKIEASDEDFEKARDILKKGFDGAVLNEEDGLRFDWSNRWVHIRKSNTEPIVRIIAEAKSKETLDKLVLRAKKTFEELR